MNILKNILLFMLVLVLVVPVSSAKDKDSFIKNKLQNLYQNKLFFINYQGLKRKYLVHIPKTYKSSDKIPVVINLHGGGGDILNAMKQTQMNKKSDEAGFLLVYPQGTGLVIGKKIFGTWNAGRCCGWAKENDIDDVGFIKKVIEDLKENFNVDEKRIYATGHSNGALMCYRLACELSTEIAAIAPNAALDSVDYCNPRRNVPILHLHGTDDPAALFNGGHCGGRMTNDPGWDCSGVIDYIDKWKSMQGCIGDKKIFYKKGKASCYVYDECDGFSEVGLCIIEGAGHTWPSGEYFPNTDKFKEAVGEINYDLAANDIIWDFFKKHSLP